MPARILVIEDNRANLELMTYLLKAFGHTLLVAHDGEAGLISALRDRPHLIVCDVQIPKLDGYEVARRLNSQPALRSIPLVAVTALAMVGDRDKVLAAGFDGYISKPIVPETFVSQVEGFLPLHLRSNPRAENQSEIASSSTSRQTTVLVVDDSPVNVSLARSMLEPFGYQVIAARGVEEALALVRKSPPDLILSDLHMPHSDGYELIRAVKADEQLSNIPFVFISSTVWREKDQTQGLELGAARFLLRPMEPEVFVKEIEACLEGRKK